MSRSVTGLQPAPPQGIVGGSDVGRDCRIASDKLLLADSKISAEGQDLGMMGAPGMMTPSMRTGSVSLLDCAFTAQSSRTEIIAS